MSIVAAQQTKANAALDMLVRFNGERILISRREIIQRRVAAGARVIERRGERVLMNQDGSWLDARNITKAGLDYAESLSQ